MKTRYPKLNMDKLCGLFGFSRQAYYQLQRYDYKSQAQCQIVLEMVRNERQSLPGIGGRKLLKIISEPMKKENINIGRDAFFQLLRDNRLLMRHQRFKLRQRIPGIDIEDILTLFESWCRSGLTNYG